MGWQKVLDPSQTDVIARARSRHTQAIADSELRLLPIAPLRPACRRRKAASSRAAPSSALCFAVLWRFRRRSPRTRRTRERNTWSPQRSLRNGGMCALAIRAAWAVPNPKGSAVIGLMWWPSSSIPRPMCRAYRPPGDCHFVLRRVGYLRLHAWPCWAGFAAVALCMQIDCTTSVHCSSGVLASDHLSCIRVCTLNLQVPDPTPGHPACASSPW